MKTLFVLFIVVLALGCTEQEGKKLDEAGVELQQKVQAGVDTVGAKLKEGKRQDR